MNQTHNYINIFSPTVLKDLNGFILLFFSFFAADHHLPV